MAITTGTVQPKNRISHMMIVGCTRGQVTVGVLHFSEKKREVEFIELPGPLED